LIQWWRQCKGTGEITPVNRADVYDRVRNSYATNPQEMLLRVESGEIPQLQTDFAFYSSRRNVLEPVPVVNSYQGRRKALRSREEPQAPLPSRALVDACR
jgi:hypothetical protein